MSNVKTLVKKLNDFVGIFCLEQKKQGDFIIKDEIHYHFMDAELDDNYEKCPDDITKNIGYFSATCRDGCDNYKEYIYNVDVSIVSIEDPSNVIDLRPSTGQSE